MNKIKKEKEIIIGNQNIKINEINKKISILTSTLKSKDFEIEKEKNKNEKLTQLYNNENQKNINLNNKISFFQQIINDKENEINNMRKLSFPLNNYKSIKNEKLGENEENKRKLLEENSKLKEKSKEYNNLQINYKELKDKYKMMTEKESQYDEIQKEINILKEQNQKIINENNKYKELVNILNIQNKNLLYENTLKNNRYTMSYIIGNFEQDRNKDENKYEKYLSTNIDELNEKLNLLLSNNIEMENGIKKKEEEKKILTNKLSEYDLTLNEMNIYIEQLEKCNETYRIYLQNYEKERNNLFVQNILDKKMNERNINESLNIQNIKSFNSFIYKKNDFLFCTIK